MTNPWIAPLRYTLPSVYGVMCALTIFLGTVTAQGATYYVATTGSDSNPGTSASPWRHPQRCTLSPIKAGDTCIVRSGTYTDTDGNGVVVFVYNRTATPSGTASQPITIKSERPLGAALVAPSNRNGFGFIVQKPYYVIEGFDISGGNNSSSSGAGVGIKVDPVANGVTIRSNAIHHIGRAACTNSTSTFSGITVTGASGAMITNNRIYSIGRKRNGEGGCSATVTSHDHGVYLKGVSNPTIQRNTIYDSNRGWPIHVYGGTTTNMNIYSNTISGKSPTGTPQGHILLSGTIRTANIQNNVSSGSQYGMVRLYNLTASNVTVSNNVVDTNLKYGSNSVAGVSFSNIGGANDDVAGITFSGNYENVQSLGFVNESTNDFRLTPQSPAINLGIPSEISPNKPSPPPPAGVRAL